MSPYMVFIKTFERYSLVGGSGQSVSLRCEECNDAGSQITVTPFKASEQVDIMMQWLNAHEKLSHAVRKE